MRLGRSTIAKLLNDKVCKQKINNVNLFSRSNEPSAKARFRIWRMPRSSVPPTPWGGVVHSGSRSGAEIKEDKEIGSEVREEVCKEAEIETEIDQEAKGDNRNGSQSKSRKSSKKLKQK